MTSRRHFLATSASLISAGAVRLPKLADAQRPRPTPAQLQWQRDELAMFVHFGMNTFTNREWGDGTEAPATFNPTALDARQWARVARSAGFRTMILTAKHHDGFCLWPTRTTEHSVAHSPFRGGNGDVVREFVDACKAEKLNAGLYLSPWDRNAKSYGDSDRYNDFYCAQLTELLTHYGKIAEVWFDGANGEGPNGKKQTYDWPRIWGTVRKLQRDAVIFSDAGPDVRWIGNENGVAGQTNWSTVDPTIVPVPGLSGDAVTRMLQQGDPAGKAWQPGETDVSIRPGWFHHPAEDARVRSVNNLISLFYTSVGRNSKLLLNVPPTSAGLIHETDAAHLAGMRAQLDSRFAHNLIRHPSARWTKSGSDATADFDLGATHPVSAIDLREDISRGQNIARYTVDGFDGSTWRPMSRGTTVGYRKLDLVNALHVDRIRVTVTDAVGFPLTLRVGAYTTP